MEPTKYLNIRRIKLRRTFIMNLSHAGTPKKVTQNKPKHKTTTKNKTKNKNKNKKKKKKHPQRNDKIAHLVLLKDGLFSLFFVFFLCLFCFCLVLFCLLVCLFVCFHICFTLLPRITREVQGLRTRFLGH